MSNVMKARMTFLCDREACPMFVVPLPRGEGFLNMVWQATEISTAQDAFVSLAVKVQDQRVLFKTLDGFQREP